MDYGARRLAAACMWRGEGARSALSPALVNRPRPGRLVEPKRTAAGANCGEMPCGCGGGGDPWRARENQQRKLRRCCRQSPPPPPAPGVFRVNSICEASNESRGEMFLYRRISSAQAKRLILIVVSRKSQAFRYLQVSTS